MTKSKANFRSTPDVSAVSSVSNSPPSKILSTGGTLKSKFSTGMSLAMNLHETPPPPSRVTALFQSLVRDGIVSPATKRNKTDTISTSSQSVIIHTLTCDKSSVGTVVDGGYAASDFFAGRLSDYDLSLLVPHSNESLRRLDVPGGLLKASEAINILKDKPKDSSTVLNLRQELIDLEKKAPYVIS